MEKKAGLVKPLIVNILLFILAFCLFLPPAVKLWPIISYVDLHDPRSSSWEMWEFISNVDEYRKSENMTLYSSENFDFYIPDGYMNREQIDSYIVWVEERYAKIKEFLKVADDELDNKKTDVFIIDGYGTSFCMPAYFVIYNRMSGMDHTVHEMVHTVDFQMSSMAGYDLDITIHPEYRSTFFWELKAVLVEEELGAGLAYPNYGLPVNSIIYAGQRRRIKMESLAELIPKSDLMDNYDFQVGEFRYAMAGSFGRYLYETYGAKALKKVINGGFLGAFQKNLDELEKEWYDWLRVGSLLQSALMILAALAVLGVVTLWVVLQKKAALSWIPTLIMTLLAFLGWGYYLNYTDGELLPILFVFLAAALFKFGKPKMGLISLWITGSGYILFQLFLPVMRVM